MSSSAMSITSDSYGDMSDIASESDSDASDYAPSVQSLPPSKTPTDRASQIEASGMACRALTIVRRLHKGQLASYKDDYFAAELLKCTETGDRWRVLWPRIPALHAWVIQDQSTRWDTLTEDEYSLCSDYDQMDEDTRRTHRDIHVSI